MRQWLSALFPGSASAEPKHLTVRNFWNAHRLLTDSQVQERWLLTDLLPEAIALTAIAAERTLGLTLFDVQLRGALALVSGHIVEMQTGEGKTLAAVPAICWLAKQKSGVHVMTVNDYLARRDSAWMGPIYRYLGLSVGCIQQDSPQVDRRAAYACDVTYSTANNIGFDYLRDGLVIHPTNEVVRPFAAAVIDEADSILIDEARIPLVIAGGDDDGELNLAVQADSAVRTLRAGTHFTVDDNSRNVALTDQGIATLERSLACANLYEPAASHLLTAVQNSLHAHGLLRRNVDYLVKNGCIESVDELQGRVARDRRWPAGLHTAIEAKERVAFKKQGRILGSVTIQNLIALYPRICGMTGTAATQADEFQRLYGLGVTVIPTNAPAIRQDLPDAVFKQLSEKSEALLAEIERAHAVGQPVLVGTASVAESAALSARLARIPHRVLNAANDEEEAAIIAVAGLRGAVTVSTNMAGRGVDIRLGPGVKELGGLYVIGANKHESRRVDNQLRGRAGRQGDPGVSRFFVSFEDDLYSRFHTEGELRVPTPDQLQRRVEGQNVSIREFLNKYEGIVENQRLTVQRWRRDRLLDTSLPPLTRIAGLQAIDELWADHLASVAELRGGVQWVSWGGRDPLHEYLTRVDRLFVALEQAIPDLTEENLMQLESTGASEDLIPGATWTYLTTDEPFGSWSDRIRKGLLRKFAG